MLSRVALGRLWQESNDLSTAPTTRDDWEANGLLRGAEIEALAGQRAAELGGCVDALSGWDGGCEIVPLAGAWCFPKGRCTADCFAWLVEEILAPLRAAGSVDGVLLCLHGALVAEGESDAEGHLLAAVREIVGPGVPIVASLDLHCHITELMLRSSDCLAVYHTYPHVDLYETGLRAAAALSQILHGGAEPVSAFVRLPLVVPPERANTQATPSQIAADEYSSWPPAFLAAARELEAEPWCLSAGVALTQPWLRVEDFGSAVLVVADSPSSRTRAVAAAERLAASLWAARESFMPRMGEGGSLLPHDEAVAKAAEHAQQGPGSPGLAVIGDGADATTSGSPGDSTQLLSEVLRHHWPRGALVAMNSAEGVAAATAAGEGAQLVATVGGVLDHRFAEPMEVRGTVERLFSAKFTIGEAHFAGMAFDMGPSATLALANNVKLVLTSSNGAHFCTELFALALGATDVTDRSQLQRVFNSSLVVAKSPGGFRATYGERATLMLSSEAPGCAPPRFWIKEYDEMYVPKVRQNLFPWVGEMQAEYTPKAAVVASLRALAMVDVARM
eukprot:SAG11_NODE_418_length_9653_cov_2.465564_6_plen_561_part_00